MREREREGEMSGFGLRLCLCAYAWSYDLFLVCGNFCISGVMFTTGRKFHSQNFLLCGMLSHHRSVYVCVPVCALKCYDEVFTVSPPCRFSPAIHPLLLRGSFSISPFHSSSPSLFFSPSTALITHTPRSGPSFRAFEVILEKILLSYTADKTSKGCIWGPFEVCVWVCVCISFCWLNHQCLLFHVCLYLSECVKMAAGQVSICLCVLDQFG